MKRTELKRTAFKRPSEGSNQLRRTRLARVGKRVAREKDARKAFSRKPSPGLVWPHLGTCEGCDNRHVYWQNLDAHHLVPRSIAAGHPNTHHLENRAWLCRKCHDDAHAGRLPHLILNRKHLDTLS